MGAQGVSVVGKGRKPEQVYAELCKAAERRFGTNPYGGHINCTHGFRGLIRLPTSFMSEGKKVTSKAIVKPDALLPANPKDETAYITKIIDTYCDYMWSTYAKFDGIPCVQLGISHYESTHAIVKSFNRRNCVSYYYQGEHGIIRASDIGYIKNTAIRFAIEHRTPVVVYGENKSGWKEAYSITLDVKKTRRKPTAAGSIAVKHEAVYVYWFCGWASC